MANKFSCLLLSAFLLLILWSVNANGVFDEKTRSLINEANKNGPYFGLVTADTFGMNLLLNHPDFHSTKIVDIAGRRFRFGKIGSKPVILVMSGAYMINTAVATQLLLSLFEIKGVVHYGTAGNVNPNLNIGDIAIAQSWSHSALWSWQRYGDGPQNELPFEGNGFTRKIGYLEFANYSADGNGNVAKGVNNLLNSVWYQPEEVYPVDGTPETAQHAFKISVDSTYFTLSQKLENVKLKTCINAKTCLSKAPKVTRVQHGTSGNVFIDNAAYRSFIHKKFNASLVDMESASVALISSQQRIPFISIEALSNLAGGGTSEKNEANTFSDLASENCVKVVAEFIKLA